MRDIRYITEDLENNYKENSIARNGNSRKYKLYIYRQNLYGQSVVWEGYCLWRTKEWSWYVDVHAALIMYMTVRSGRWCGMCWKCMEWQEISVELIWNGWIDKSYYLITMCSFSYCRYNLWQWLRSFSVSGRSWQKLAIEKHEMSWLRGWHQFA